MKPGEYKGQYQSAYMDVTAKTGTPFITLTFELVDGPDDDMAGKDYIGRHVEVRFFFSQKSAETAGRALNDLQKLKWNQDTLNPDFPALKERPIRLEMEHDHRDGKTYETWRPAFVSRGMGKGASGAEKQQAAERIKAFMRNKGMQPPAASQPAPQPAPEPAPASSPDPATLDDDEDLF